jgi:hypothetical protein
MAVFRPRSDDITVIPLNPSQLDFHLEEYRQMRAEVGSIIAGAESLVKAAVVISAAVFAWLSTQGLGLTDTGAACLKLPVSAPITSLAWWIPAASILIIGLLGAARFIRVKQIGFYLRTLERSLGNVELGWERYLTKRAPVVALTSILAWACLLTAAVLLAVFMTDFVAPLDQCIRAVN